MLNRQLIKNGMLLLAENAFVYLFVCLFAREIYFSNTTMYLRVYLYACYRKGSSLQGSLGDIKNIFHTVIVLDIIHIY